MPSDMSKLQKLLQKQDIPPATVIERKGNIIFSSPHNGRAVPACLKPCLGMDEQWFHSAHEAMDLHVDKLFTELQDTLDNVSFVSGNYSRLVCDLNALPDYAIERHSPEYSHIKIEQNQPDICCAHQHMLRIEEIYWPYHDAKKHLIDKKRETHGGVIVLDIHSFAPTWEQKKRNVELGTIRCEKTPFSRAFEEFLRSQQSEFLFVSGEPYRVAERPNNAAPLITKRNDLQYLGLEIRNDLIAHDTGIQKITELLKNAMDYLLAHPDIDNIIKRRSEIEDNRPLTPIDHNVAHDNCSI